MKLDIVKIVKLAGMALSVAGMIATGWAGSKENKKVLEELVNNHFNDQ